MSSCRWCDAPIRKATVVVGAPPGREVEMMIDTEPHPDGRIIQRDDGTLRLLGRANRVRRPAFRKHGRRGCDGVVRRNVELAHEPN